MKKRFVVLIESSSEEQNNSFLSWIRQERLGWWHWFQDAWLLSDPTGDQTAISVRDKVWECFPGSNTLVIELGEGEGTWSGFGPKSEKKDMFSWIRKNWRKA